MKMFRCDVCGSRLNRPDDCFVSLSAFSKRVDDRFGDKTLKVNERIEVCPECWEAISRAAESEIKMFEGGAE